MTVRKANGEDVTSRGDAIETEAAMSLTYSDFVYPQAQLTEPEVVDIIGSLSDLNNQQFRGSSGNLTYTGSSYLPNEFQVIQDSPVPLLQVHVELRRLYMRYRYDFHWENLFQFNCFHLQNLEEADHDFIIIAEFSELEGPIPICTIPRNAPEKTDINLNSFAVHLMSTDYQVNTV